MPRPLSAHIRSSPKPQGNPIKRRARTRLCDAVYVHWPLGDPAFERLSWLKRSALRAARRHRLCRRMPTSCCQHSDSLPDSSYISKTRKFLIFPGIFGGCLEAPGRLEIRFLEASSHFQGLQMPRSRTGAVVWPPGAPGSSWKLLESVFPALQELPDS